MIDSNLTFKPLTAFRQTPEYLVLHHEAGQGTVEEIHRYHLSKGWSGIAYHAYVRRDGSVYAGRPLDKQGGHTSGYNSNSIGICFEGNFETETMGTQQLIGGMKAINEVLAKYPHLKIVGHRELTPTACPGKNFPLEYFKQYEEDEMTQEQFNTMMDNYLAQRDTKPESDWSAVEGNFLRAKVRKIMDGTKPQGFVTREQLTAVLGRLGLLK